MKRSKNTLLLCVMLIMVLVLASCGGKSTGESSSAADSAADSGTAGSDVKDKPEAEGAGPQESPASDSGSFDGLGNDPNNIYQGMFTLAFDDEHLYFSDEGILTQVRYDGTEAKLLAEGRCAFLNCWEGNLYFISNTSDALRLKKLDPTTCETSDVCVLEGSCDATGMLIVDGIALIAFQSGSGRVIAADLASGETHELLSGAGDDPRLSVSAGQVYAFVRNMDDEIGTWTVSRDQLMSGSMTSAAEARDFGLYNTVILRPEGVNRINWGVSTPDEKSYETWLYADIKEDGAWPSSRQLSDAMGSWDTEARSTAGDKKVRYQLKDSLAVICGGEIYYYPGFDFSKQTAAAQADVGDEAFNDEDARHGVHGDTLYAVEVGDSQLDCTIVTVHADGTSERIPVTFSDVQPNSAIGIMLENRVEDGDFTWRTFTNKAVLLSYNGSENTEVVIPDNYQGKPVQEIFSSAFEDHSELTSVTLPSTLVSIGEEAFSECTGLTSIQIPDGVTSLGRSVFAECTSLAAFNIPAGVTDILRYTFYHTAIASIEIPETVLTIGAGAFEGCPELAEVTLHEGLTGIGESAFEYCPNLREIFIPHSVELIEDFAFSIGYEGSDHGLMVIRGGEAAKAYADRSNVPEYIEE